MEYILCIVLGFYIGYKIAEAILLWTFKKALDELGVTHSDLKKLHKKLGEELGVDVPETNAADLPSSLPVVAIKVEQHGDMLYVFRKDTDQFLGQAGTPEELIRRLGEKITNTKLTIDREDGGELLGGAKWSFDVGTKEITKVE